MYVFAAFCAAFCFVLSKIILYIADNYDIAIPKTAGIILLILLLLFEVTFLLGILWIFFAIGAKRCHDRNNSGWYQIIPFYGAWMLFADGTPGTNKYGPDPKGRNESDKNRKLLLWEKIAITITILLTILDGIYVIDSLKNSLLSIDNTEAVAELPENVISDGYIMATIPEGVICKKINLSDDQIALQYFDKEEDPLYSITIVSFYNEKITDELFQNIWETNKQQVIEEEPYEIILDECSSENGVQVWRKAVACQDIDFIWDFMVQVDSDTKVGFISNSQYEDNSNIPLDEIISGIKFIKQ